MSNINAKDLEKAIYWLRNNAGLRDLNARATDYLDLAADAAAAHLATLPREVPVTAWAVVRPDGTVFELLYSEGDAVSEALLHGYVATPLTGTATIPAGKP